MATATTDRLVLLDDIDEEYRCVNLVKSEILHPVVSAALHAQIAGDTATWDGRTFAEQAAYVQGLQAAERLLSDHLDRIVDTWVVD